MLDKINKGLNIFILVILGISFIFLLVSVVSGWVTDYKNSKNQVLSNEQIDIYVNDINKVIEDDETVDMSNLEIVKDYTLFYSLQDACENFLQYIIEQKYGTTYNIVTKEIKDNYSNFEYIDKMKGFEKNNLATINILDDPIVYTNRNNLLNAYKVGENSYICQVRNNAGDSFKLGIRINQKNNTYKVFYIEF